METRRRKLEKLRDQEYIGDGVYVGHDGYHIWLYANDHRYPTDRIALEPAVFASLNRYVNHLKEAHKNG